VSPDAAAHDPPPTRHRVAELPALAAEITEYQGQARTCPGCGKGNILQKVALMGICRV
jgi:hypothetical protein